MLPPTLPLTHLWQHPEQLGHALGFPHLTASLHGEWLRDMLRPGGEDLTILAHRGSYKTTCLSLALALRMALYPTENIIFFRKGDDDVTEILSQVRTIIRHPAYGYITGLLYPSPVTVKRSTAFEITTSVYTTPRGAPQLLGMGTGGSMTGKHADLIVTDDIVNLRDRTSYAERERVKNVYMELQNIRNRGGRIINTGTPWHREDAISLMPGVKRYDCYTTGLIGKKELARLRASMSPSLFAANYELRHMAQENALFPENPPQGEEAVYLRGGVAHIDAAYGGGDGTALTCGHRVGDTLYLYGRLWPETHVDRVLDTALMECTRHMASPIALEINGDKGYLAREIRRRGYAVRPYSERMNKHVKIASYLRKWWTQIHFVEGTDPGYIAQILDYTADSPHDDAPDSAACVCRLLDRR